MCFGHDNLIVNYSLIEWFIKNEELGIDKVLACRVKRSPIPFQTCKWITVTIPAAKTPVWPSP